MKDFCSIIKNYQKFGEIKLSNPVRLYQENTEFRDGIDGVSTNLFGTKWFLTPKGKVLFKYAEEHLYSPMDKSKIRMFNELLVYAIAKRANLNCADYQPAILEHNERDLLGIASYNFLASNEIVIPFSDYMKINDIIDANGDYLHILKSLTTGKFTKYSFDISEIKKQLYEMIVLDTLTLQTDRNLSNIAFILNETTGDLRLAPIHDNEYAFLLGSMPFSYIDFDENNNIQKYIENFYDGNFLAQVFLIDKSGVNFNHDVLDKQIANIVKLAYLDCDLKNSLRKILSVNIDAVYNSIESDGNKINETYKQYTVSLYNYVKQLIITEIVKQKNNGIEL